MIFPYLGPAKCCSRSSTAVALVRVLLDCYHLHYCSDDCLVGLVAETVGSVLVVRRPLRERKISGLNPACAGIFSGSNHTSDLKIGTPRCQAPGVIGSALGLVGPVSVYCDWVRWKVWSATFMSVWQHVKLSSQIRP